MECIICQEPVGDVYCSCGLHPSHIYCFECFFKRWLSQALPQIEDSNVLMSFDSFQEYIANQRLGIFGPGQYYGTPWSADTMVCDLDKVPVQCFDRQTVEIVPKERVVGSFMAHIADTLVPENPQLVDHSIAYYRTLYLNNQKLHADNLQNLQQCVSIIQTYGKRVENYQTIIAKSHDLLYKMKFLVTLSIVSSANKQAYTVETILERVLQYMRGDLSDEAFDLASDELAGKLGRLRESLDM